MSRRSNSSAEPPTESGTAQDVTPALNARTNEPQTIMSRDGQHDLEKDTGMAVRRNGFSRLAGLACAFASIVLCTLAAPMATGATQERRTAADCASSLTCTIADINLLSMTERLEFVRAMQAGPAAALGATDRWRNIEGVISCFRDRGLGSSGTWVSYVDASIVEAIERGVAIALGRSDDGFGNPGSALWAGYLQKLSTGQLAARSEHDRTWSRAEQTSTDNGSVLAAQHGQYATPAERRFFEFTNVYRFALRARPAALNLLGTSGPFKSAGLAPLRVPFYDWFTDVSESEPSYYGCNMAYDYARFQLVGGAVGTMQLFLAYVPALFDEYRSLVP